MTDPQPEPRIWTRYVAVGDSFTYGLVPYPANVMTLLEQALRRACPHRDVDLLNFGIGATGVRDYRTLIELAYATYAPDLVLIDGGPGQLSAAVAVLAELGLGEIKIAAVAKGPDRNAGRERIYMKGREPLLLEPRDPVLYCIQKFRDEAHRFAIGAHRARRKKQMQTSPLDEIQGIGPTRKRALLQHFGSAKAVRGAALQDLERAPGISKAMAQAIHDHFHPRG